jgi:subtilisin family serine protease
VSADRAWKFSAGDPRVKVAILDTGIRWENQELVDRIALNRGELPLPQGCTVYDCNGDGAFNVEDYAHDSRVSKAAGDDSADSILDPSDLIATFSDGTDADHNGYVDDIAGWDFFNDDNDPFDQSSYSSANNHGTGRAEDAAEEGNDGQGGIGLCPHCQILPLRVWDTFVQVPPSWSSGSAQSNCGSSGVWMRTLSFGSLPGQP